MILSQNWNRCFSCNKFSRRGYSYPIYIFNAPQKIKCFIGFYGNGDPGRNVRYCLQGVQKQLVVFIQQAGCAENKEQPGAFCFPEKTYKLCSSNTSLSIAFTPFPNLSYKYNFSQVYNFIPDDYFLHNTNLRS